MESVLPERSCRTPPETVIRILQVSGRGLACKKNLFDCPARCIRMYGASRGNQITFFRSSVIPCNGSILELDFFLSIEKKKHGIFKGLEKVL
jgi:hypothetical protein